MYGLEVSSGMAACSFDFCVSRPGGWAGPASKVYELYDSKASRTVATAPNRARERLVVMEVASETDEEILLDRYLLGE